MDYPPGKTLGTSDEETVAIRQACDRIAASIDRIIEQLELLLARQ